MIGDTVRDLIYLLLHMRTPDHSMKLVQKIEENTPGIHSRKMARIKETARKVSEKFRGLKLVNITIQMLGKLSPPPHNIQYTCTKGTGKKASLAPLN